MTRPGPGLGSAKVETGERQREVALDTCPGGFRWLRKARFSPVLHTKPQRRLLPHHTFWSNREPFIAALLDLRSDSSDHALLERESSWVNSKSKTFAFSRRLMYVRSVNPRSRYRNSLHKQLIITLNAHFIHLFIIQLKNISLFQMLHLFNIHNGYFQTITLTFHS